jgi:hypothetical protein
MNHPRQSQRNGSQVRGCRVVGARLAPRGFCFLAMAGSLHPSSSSICLNDGQMRRVGTQLLRFRTNPRICGQLGKYDICCEFIATSRQLVLDEWVILRHATSGCAQSTMPSLDRNSPS